MSKFNVVKNITIPASVTAKPRNEMFDVLDSLEIGDGFEYESKGKLQSQYGKVSPKKFGKGKKFKLWLVAEAEQDGGLNTYGVARVAMNADGVTDEQAGEDTGNVED